MVSKSLILGGHYKMNNIIYCGVNFIICTMSYIYPMVVEVLFDKSLRVEKNETSRFVLMSFKYGTDISPGNTC